MTNGKLASRLVMASESCGSLPCGAMAASATYTFTATGPITSSLGGVPIDGGGELLAYSFVGNTSNVLGSIRPCLATKSLSEREHSV